MTTLQNNVQKIFANKAALTRAVGVLSCSITQDVAYDPVTCPCGHLFDRPALITWLGLSSTCPISRNPMHMRDITTNRIVADIINALGFSRGVEASVPELADASTAIESANIMSPPYIACADEHLGVVDLSPEQLSILDGDRFICVEDFLVNPQSSLLPWVGEYLQQNNIKVLQKLNPSPPGTFHYIAMRKYTYHHISDDEAYVAYELASQGYFVYDLFSVHKNRSNTRYILYSIEWLADSRPVPLARFKKNSRDLF